ncbi:MAG: hypothetical protein CFE23_05440 [Flavobacterium sp. BFFFF1]|uniref:hypothetical protein n=1 Tax=Flavobacterium sp. BFFFF1 TaxID=2015557 RepID=UPI000BCA7B6D|nr:hypothetical protein [Flavobacterium sp. BFFFF1]OYU81210.1 MAG: hypothetical protein CFE23_05440 [Flavobacterium sp. BFFFF1]
MNNLLKRLTVISFSLLFLPFFQTCSDDAIINSNWSKNSPLREAEPVTDSLHDETVGAADAKEFHLTYDELKQKKVLAIQRFIDGKAKATLSGYQLGLLAVNDFSWEFNIMFAFTIVLILCVCQLFMSFTGRYKWVFITGCCNAVLSLFPFAAAFHDGAIEDLSQIKFGFYLFYTNVLLITYVSNKLYNEAKSTHNFGEETMVK